MVVVTTNKPTAHNPEQANRKPATNSTPTAHTPARTRTITSTPITSRNNSSKKPKHKNASKTLIMTNNNNNNQATHTPAQQTSTRTKNAPAPKPPGSNTNGRNKRKNREPTSTKPQNKGQWGTGWRPWGGSRRRIMSCGPGITSSPVASRIATRRRKGNDRRRLEVSCRKRLGSFMISSWRKLISWPISDWNMRETIGSLIENMEPMVFCCQTDTEGVGLIIRAIFMFTLYIYVYFLHQII